MNPALYVCIFLPLIVILLSLGVNKNELLRRRIIKRNKIRRGIRMSELVLKYIGKDCIIYTFNGSNVEGVITDIKDNFIEIEAKDGKQIISIDFVMRIREYPKNTKGKKKSLVLD